MTAAVIISLLARERTLLPYFNTSQPIVGTRSHVLALDMRPSCNVDFFNIKFRILNNFPDDGSILPKASKKIKPKSSGQKVSGFGIRTTPTHTAAHIEQYCRLGAPAPTP